QGDPAERAGAEGAVHERGRGKGRAEAGRLATSGPAVRRQTVQVPTELHERRDPAHHGGLPQREETGGVAVRKARKGVTMQATEGHPVHRTGTQRIEALGDGVFAIVMTLLIFDLKLPEVEAPAALGPALLALWPSFLAFAISFGLLGIYWLGHRAQFQFIQ